MGPEELRSFYLSPPPDSIHETREILTRLSWYARSQLSEGGNLVLSSSDLVEKAMKLGAPFWAGSDAREAFHALHANITNEVKPAAAVEYINWREVGSRRSNHGSAHESWRLCPWADSEGDQKWIAFAESCAPPRTPNERNELRTRLSKNDARRAVLIGPGPSLTQLRQPASDDILLMTLSAHLNSPLGAGIQPDLLIFADALAIVGPSSVAQTNRDALAKAADRGALLVTTARIARILANQLPPRIRSQIFGFLVSTEPQAAIPQSLIEGPLPNTNNVLTMLGFPIVAGLAKQVELIGFDGLLRHGQTYDHHKNLEQIQRTSLLRAAHPNIGQKSSYYDDHRHHTALIVSSLIAEGIAFSPAPSEMDLPVVSDAGIAVGNSEPARHIYAALDNIDRLSPERFVFLATLSILICVGASMFAQRSITLENLLASFALSTLVVVIGIFIIRRRQNRLIEQLRHDVMVNVQEMNQIIIQRLDHLERGHSHPVKDE